MPSSVLHPSVCPQMRADNICASKNCQHQVLLQCTHFWADADGVWQPTPWHSIAHEHRAGSAAVTGCVFLCAFPQQIPTLRVTCSPCRRCWVNGKDKSARCVCCITLDAPMTAQCCISKPTVAKMLIHSVNQHPVGKQGGPTVPLTAPSVKGTLAQWAIKRPLTAGIEAVALRPLLSGSTCGARHAALEMFIAL